MSYYDKACHFKIRFGSLPLDGSGVVHKDREYTIYTCTHDNYKRLKQLKKLNQQYCVMKMQCIRIYLKLDFGQLDLFKVNFWCCNLCLRFLLVDLLYFRGK